VKYAARVIISGLVQGVFFRASAIREARRLRLVGWVKNRQDGCVELYAEGERGQLDELIRWCRIGPSTARVDDVQVAWLPAKEGFATFEVAG
jgi:acylphosphatase